jgi:hypothetical protein
MVKMKKPGKKKLVVGNWEGLYFLLITWMRRKMWNMMKVGRIIVGTFEKESSLVSL